MTAAGRFALLIVVERLVVSDTVATGGWIHGSGNSSISFTICDSKCLAIDKVVTGFLHQLAIITICTSSSAATMSKSFVKCVQDDGVDLTLEGHSRHLADNVGSAR